MIKSLNNRLGSVDTAPLEISKGTDTVIGGGILKATEKAQELKRGTILAKDENGKLSVMDEGRRPDCILCEDTETETADKNVVVYVSGDFNAAACYVAEGYELTNRDLMALREKGISLSNFMA